MYKNKAGRLLTLCVVALSVWMLSACDDTMGGDTATAPVFPTDTLEKVGAPNDTVVVLFSAGTNWKLVSNKDWCRVDGKYMNTSGKCGKHSVAFVISDKGHDFNDETAEITLWMNDEHRVIARITRRAKGYFMEVCHDEKAYAAGESIMLGTSGSIKLKIRTNVGSNQLRMHYPEWLSIVRSGEDLTLKVNEDSVKYTINNPTDSLILYKNDSTFSRGFHVQYEGMDSLSLYVNPKIETTLIVSRDAKRCHIGNVLYDNPITFTITARNDRYELVRVAYDEDKGCSLMADEACWFDTEDNHQGRVSVSFAEENNGDERVAYLLALPQAIVDSIVDTADNYEEALSNYLWETKDGKNELREDVEIFNVIKMAQDGVMGITISPETRWNLKIATDGKTYTDAIRGDTCEAPVEASITTYRGYELMCASYDNKVGCTLMKVEDSWLNVADDKKGNVKVYFKANSGNERILYLFALPLPLVESLEPESAAYDANLANELFEKVNDLSEIKTDAEKFIIAKFTQEANQDNSMRVFDKEFKGIDVQKETDEAWLDSAATRGVPADKVFRCSMKVGYAYTINSLIPISTWDTSDESNSDRIEVYGKTGVKYVSGKGQDYEEDHVIMDEIEGSNYMLVTFTASRKRIQEDFIIYFVDNDTNYLKALVVTRL